MGLRVGNIYLRKYPVGFGMILIWVLGAFGLSVAAYRWIVGLGATTALSDGRGWGIWISFDMMSGVALAAGAFTLSAVVYIFNLKEFYPIVRPTILTGFISYLLAAMTLLVDLGLPIRIWHLLIYQNVHSPLFEIGICVMTYLTVLALEFSPIVFESLGWKVPLKWVRRITIPLVIAGAVLSTMHQSTLGTMLTIMPTKIHPLWYSRLMPLYFYLTAIAAGLAMTIFEMYHSARTYQYKFELRLASKLAKAIPVVLGIYLVIRTADLVITGNYVYLFQGGWPTLMFIAEVVGGVIFPSLLMLDPFMRNHRDGVVWAATFVIGGLILNRFNASLIFMSGDFYLPSWSEIAVSIGLTCLGLIMYDAAIRFLPMFPEPSHEAVKTL
ncbi:MAG TPA: Ni/Fe-hydrogenase cytochrome b subunit [Bellilinea sp.]|jgi:Ni/Fe-hydrogenase subunit HybB-like protein|nr:Ni/Fe-hydrogenase cytochrome b subunit [Bellilinea sp.]